MNINYCTTLYTNRKRGKHLNFEERCIIKVLNKQGMSLRQIAKRLNCSPSTVHYELKRGTAKKKKGRGRPPEYNPNLGQKTYDENRKRCCIPYKLFSCKPFIDYIVRLLKRTKYSLYDCLIKACNTHMFSSEATVSLKTLYNYVWKGLIEITPMDLPEALSRKTNVKRKVRPNKRLKGRSIEERPVHMSNYTEVGHWEIDTVVGKRKGKGEVILTLLEKVTRKYLAFKIPGKTSSAVVNKMLELKQFYGERFSEVFKSITADNGSEFETLSKLESYGTLIYFAHPYSSWERPQNERHNRMLRSFIPKGEAIEKYSEEQVLYFVDQINDKPRMILNNRSSDEVFEAFLDKVYAL